MISPKLFDLGKYELCCGAAESDSGKFEPALVIAMHTWPRRPRVIAVRRGAHPTVEMARESARVQGMEWVKNYG